jgi:dolichyl-phosphate-mannose--protein O-mannosyl transferase
MSFALTRSFPLSWFKLVMIGIFLFSLFIRLWRLSQFNVLVFDEVYYAKFANDYLIGTHFFNSHPPLSQYLIAMGIWLGSHLPAATDSVNDLTGSLRSTFSYRWLNALTGSFLPLVVGAIAYQLSHRRSYTMIASLLTAFDGLFLVESRYALNNIYLVIFGLLGHLFFLMALNNCPHQSWLLLISGVFLGASAAVKWNGLGFLLGIYILLAIAWLNYPLNFWQRYGFSKKYNFNTELDFLKKIRAIKWQYLVFNLGLIPFFTYSILWIPHLLMNPEYGFWAVHQKILAFHESIGSGPKVHPYCSRWYSWLFMWRPVAYFYEKSQVSPGVQQIHDVHAMGNPIVWWLSTVAIITALIGLIIKLFLRKQSLNATGDHVWISTYLTVNYVANLLPWVKVSRCTFLYHYMAAYVFAILALAVIVDRCLRSNSKRYRTAGKLVLVLVIAAFIYWLPIYLGLPLSTQDYYLRMLFSNWI